MGRLIPTHHFMDAAVVGPGSGAIGDAYKSIENCIVSETFDLVNCTQLNLRSNAPHVLTADLTNSLTSAAPTPPWVPTYTAPLIIRGYDDVANDGGKAILSGGGLVGILNNVSLDHIIFIDVIPGDCGGATVINGNNKWLFYRVKAGDTTGNGVAVDADAIAFMSHFHNSDNNFQTTGPALVWGCIADTASLRNYDSSSGDGFFGFCIARCTGAAEGISIGQTGFAMHNSVRTEGSGNGIESRRSIPGTIEALLNNVVEGVTGQASTGIDENVNDPSYTNVRGGNSTFDCDTDVTPPAATPLLDFGDEVLAESPFTDAANLDFSPVDTGSIINGSVLDFHPGFNPNNHLVLNRGAVQESSSSPGGNQLRLSPGAVQGIAPEGGSALLHHNDGGLVHNAATLLHKTTTFRHNDPTLQHKS